MLTPSEIDKKFARRALKAAEALTPAHAAAEAGMNADGTDGASEAERRRDRVQHEADPYLHEAPEVDHLDCAEVAKRFNQAFDTPDGYPAMRPVAAEQFRRPPATAGHGYGPPGRPVPVPSATLTPGMITRPPLSDGRSRPSAPEAC